MAVQNVRINGRPQSDWDGMIMFTEIPNIVSYTNTDNGTKARMEIKLNSNFTPVKSGETLTINGDTVVSTTDITQVGGRYFYGGANTQWFVPTLVNALRNCPNIVSNYDVRVGNDEDGDIDSVVVIEARTTGSKYNIVWDASDGMKAFDRFTGMHISYTVINGTSSDELKNVNFAKLQLQLYKYTDFNRYGNVDTYGEAISKSEYVTTLEKTYYSNEVRFDISPVLSTIAEYGRLVYFRFSLTLFSSSSSHAFEELAVVHNMYVVHGYRCNASIPYFTKRNVPCVLQEFGNGIDWANLDTLYVYKPSIDFSFVSTAETNTIQMTYLDSAYNPLFSSILSINNNKIDNSISLTRRRLDEASYVRITLPDNRGNLIYNIIKGMNASKRCVRMNWRNEYGGISFFDYTGNQDEVLEIDSNEYEMSNLYYHDSNDREQIVVYNRDVTHKYTVKSHLISKSGTKIFESLAKSKRVWIYNEETTENEYIIIDDIKIDVVNDQDDIYEVTVTYHMSREN